MPVPLNAIVSGEFGALLTIETDPETALEAVGVNTTLNCAVPPAAMFMGVDILDMLNAAPVTVADEIASEALPLFERVIVCELLLPTVTLPKLALAGVAENCGWVPVPVSGTVREKLEPEPPSTIVPLTAPAVVGVKLAEKGTLWPTLTVSGVAKPNNPNPVPVALADETVMLAVPEFVRVKDLEPLLPTATLPKLTLVGLTPSTPCAPEPVSGMFIGEPAALLTTEMFPVSFPAAVGANCTAKVVLAPALIVPAPIPLMVNPVPVAVADMIVSAAFPVFDKVMFCDELAPTFTFPKLTFDELASMIG